MSHLDGFATADVDVTLLDDAKIRALVRMTRDEGLVARCVVGYTATMLGSWKTGERIPLEEACPLWLTDVEDVAERLVAARLLDAEHRVLEHAFEARFGTAHARREQSRERWRKSARRGRSGPATSTDADSTASSPRGPDADAARSHAPSVPLLPSVPSDPTGSVLNARRRGRLEPIGSILPRLAPGGTRS